MYMTKKWTNRTPKTSYTHSSNTRTAETLYLSLIAAIPEKLKPSINN